MLTGEQLEGWKDFYSREPFGFPIEDVRAAMTMSVIANSAGADPRMAVEDFSLAERLIDGPETDDGPSGEALARKLEKLMPPRPPGEKE